MSDSIFVIAGGNSISKEDLSLLADKQTIAVNKSFLHVPNCNNFITLDNSFLNKLSEEEKKEFYNQSKMVRHFIVNFGSDKISEDSEGIYDKKTKRYYDLSMYDNIVRSYDREGLSVRWSDFRSGNNSAHSALQLAILLRYKKIYLLGMDYCYEEQTHFHGGYKQSEEIFKKRLEDYYRMTKEALIEFQKEYSFGIYSCSKTSRLNDVIDYVPIERAL